MRAGSIDRAETEEWIEPRPTESEPAIECGARTCSWACLSSRCKCSRRAGGLGSQASLSSRNYRGNQGSDVGLLLRLVNLGSFRSCPTLIVPIRSCSTRDSRELTSINTGPGSRPRRVSRGVAAAQRNLDPERAGMPAGQPGRTWTPGSATPRRRRKIENHHSGYRRVAVSNPRGDRQRSRRR